MRVVYRFDWRWIIENDDSEIGFDEPLINECIDEGVLLSDQKSGFVVAWANHEDLEAVKNNVFSSSPKDLSVFKYDYTGGLSADTCGWKPTKEEAVEHALERMKSLASTINNAATELESAASGCDLLSG